MPGRLNFDEALRPRPVFIEGLIDRGNLFQELERPLEALASCNDALENAPGRADILNNRGSALLMSGRAQEVGMDFAKEQALHAVRSMTVFQKSPGVILDARRP